MTDRIEQLLADYWDAAYAEGKEGRTHDTEDARAQKTLSAIRAEFRALRQRVADLEEEYKELRDNRNALIDKLSELNAPSVQPCEPVAYGLLMPNGQLDTELVGSKADCEFWTRAEGERQSGWRMVAIYVGEVE